MAYNPTDWRDRVVERPRTYSLQDNGDGTYTLLPMPGNIIEPGTPVNAGNMNKIEQGIADTSQSLEQHINANTGVHGATPNATPSRIVIRDGNGRAAVANPVNNNHIANKQYVDDAADAAEQAAKEWANAENVTVISPIAADVPGSEYPYGVTMFNFINVHGYPVDQGTALNINDPNPYRFTQIITYSTQNNTFAGETYIRIWRQDSGWSPFRKIWDSNNLPNPAQTDVANAFTQNQVIDKNIPLLLVRSRHTTGHVAGMQMQDAGGSDKWVAGFSPSVGTYSVYDYEAGHTALMIEPGATGRMLYRGNEVWHTGLLRWNNGVLEYNDNGTWRAVSGVKGVQSGSVNISADGNPQTINIGISSVNVNKAVINLPDLIAIADDSLDVVVEIKAYLSSSTNLRIECLVQRPINGLRWQVIEHY